MRQAGHNCPSKPAMQLPRRRRRMVEAKPEEEPFDGGVDRKNRVVSGEKQHSMDARPAQVREGGESPVRVAKRFRTAERQPGGSAEQRQARLQRLQS
jgi:hypothetical protein